MEYQLSRYRWIIVGLFWIVIFAFGANWFALSPMLKTFETQFTIPSWQSHLLLSIIGMFVIFFAWPAGTLIDKKGPKLSVTIGAFFMMIGFGLRPWLLPSFSGLMLSSIIAGIGFAWILVAMAPQMLRWFPAKQAGLPVGIAASGLFIGFGTGSLAMPILVTTTSVFNSFLFLGVITIFAFILWILAAKDHPQTPPERREAVEKMKFAEGMRNILSSKNAFIYPFIGFFIVGLTLVISGFIHQLYPSIEGGYIAGMLLYGCALGAFIAPFATKKIRIKTVSLVVLAGTLVFWVLLYALFTVNISWLLLVLVAFLFGFCLQASWPLALYCQETEQGVSQANIGVSASLYISVSNIGAALLPVLFPLLFPAQLSTVVAVLAGLIITFVLWAVIKRKP